MTELNPNGLHFTPPDGKGRGADAYDEGVTPGPRFGQDFDVLARDESEFHQTTFKSGVLARADPEHGTRGPGRQSTQAEGAGCEGFAPRGCECVHVRSMIENRSHLQCEPRGTVKRSARVI